MSVHRFFSEVLGGLSADRAFIAEKPDASEPLGIDRLDEPPIESHRQEEYGEKI